MLKSNVCSLINLSDSYFQCCGARAAWSRHFKGGAGADFLFGPSREPEPPFLRRLRLYLFGKHKGKPCVVTKDDLKAVCNGCLLDPDPGGISLSGSMRIRIRNTGLKDTHLTSTSLLAVQQLQRSRSRQKMDIYHKLIVFAKASLLRLRAMKKQLFLDDTPVHIHTVVFQYRNIQIFFIDLQHIEAQCFNSIYYLYSITV